MAKKIKSIVKLQIEAGQASPAQVGSSLGPHGINMMDFCKQFNAKTQDQPGYKIPVVISVYDDRTFSFITKTPPAATLIIKEIGIPKGSAEPNKNKVGKITQAQLEKIAKTKMVDLNAFEVEAAKKVIAGTARSMGVEVID